MVQLASLLDAGVVLELSESSALEEDVLAVVSLLEEVSSAEAGVGDVSLVLELLVVLVPIVAFSCTHGYMLWTLF